MSISYGGDNIQDTDGGVLRPSSSVMRNRIINGSMTIDQRNAGASGTATSYTVDRWQFYAGLSTKGTWQQNAGSITPPTGFSNYLGFTSNSTYSISSSDYFTFAQLIEGYNVADLGWGTADAKTVTLSFWVRSSLTGTFGGSLKGASNTRSYPFTYTISTANTWEQKSITVTGCPDGTWLTTNGIGLWVSLGLGVGSTYSTTAGAWATGNYLSATGATSVVGTSGATFYITGVQLEVGSSATGFEYRQYGTELALCQRYYFRLTNDNGYTVNLTTFQAYGAGSAYGKLCDLPVQMRANPTGSLSAIGSFAPSNTAGAGLSAFSSGTVDVSTKNYLATGGFSGSSGLTAGNCTSISIANNAWIAASAEL